jgi:hypothetical protein
MLTDSFGHQSIKTNHEQTFVEVSSLKTNGIRMQRRVTKNKTMKHLIYTLIFAILSFAALAEESNFQTVKGRVLDKDSRQPIVGVMVVIVDSEPVIGTTTDIDGYFALESVPLGRINLAFSFVGYHNQLKNEVLVLSAKETFLSIELEESVTTMEELIIYSDQDKSSLNNEMALVSARGFNVEETMRFAGALNDPARMATSFAGVANTNDGRNDIIIRGNSATGLLWRMNGLDIPNPNHYGILGTTGGPVTMLNNNQLANSDFMTAAFPAEYGNALSGVFDLSLRNGNRDRHEFLGQVGFNGLELGAEGPLSRKNRSSYMVNYRYSTMGLAKAAGFDFGTGAAVPEYQDLSYKLNIPTKKGAIEMFGMMGMSDIDLLGSEQDLEGGGDLYGNETEDIYNHNKLMVNGISYRHNISNKAFLKLTAGYIKTREETLIDSLLYEGPSTISGKARMQQMTYELDKFTTHLNFNKKFNARNHFTAGYISDFHIMDIDHEYRIPDTDDFYTLRAADDEAYLGRLYAQWKHKFSDRLQISIGANSQFFDLAEAYAVEPRFGASYAITPTSSFSFGYGLHSQLQPLPVYFTNYQTEDGTSLQTNRDLDFVRSHHWVLGYDRMIADNLHLKLEAYYQYIFNAAVDSLPSTYSILNEGADFGNTDRNFLQNEGEGINFGLDLTLEKFFSNNYYFMVTGSVFDSRYLASDGAWRNSAFNGRYMLNILAGKEWKIGGRNTLAIDWKMKAAGGRYYTPVDLEASQAAGVEIRNESLAFESQLNDYFRTDIKVSYRMNRSRLTHEFSLDLQNITNRTNDFLPVYNRRTNSEAMVTQIGFFPVPQYRIYF